MALGPPTVPIFEGFFISHGMTGVGMSQLAVGCATGLQLYMTGGCTVISIDVGTLGVGSGIGLGMFLPGPLLTGIMSSLFVASLIAGPFSPITAEAISFGISSSLLTANISTINAGVGIGVGKVQCIPNGTGGTLFTSALISSGMTGSSIPSLGQAIGGALDSSISSAQGIVAIVGSPNILPSAGVGFGQIS
jgi:hypothetical protein